MFGLFLEGWRISMCALRLVPHCSQGTAETEVMGSQVELAEEFEKGMGLSCSSVAGSSDLLDQDVLALASSDPADCMLLAPSIQEEVDVVEEGKDSNCTEPSYPASPAYGELLDVMACATTRLYLAWSEGDRKWFKVT